MNYTTEQITFQEVPNEISLSFLIAGCPLKCKGCHSADSWRATSEAIKSKIHPINNNVQNQLTTEYLENRIKQYQDMISCVLFLGGEWKIKQLIELLQTVKNTNPSLKTCLYTGLELDEIVELIEQEINEKVEIGWKYIFDNNLLDYLKTGRWIRELGGLDNKKTNQQFYKVNVNHEERSSSSYTSKSSEVGIFSRNNSSSGLFTIDMDNNCSDNSTKSQSNIKQALSNILIDKTWMFH